MKELGRVHDDYEEPSFSIILHCGEQSLPDPQDGIKGSLHLMRDCICNHLHDLTLILEMLILYDKGQTLSHDHNVRSALIEDRLVHKRDDIKLVSPVTRYNI